MEINTILSLTFDYLAFFFGWGQGGGAKTHMTNRPIASFSGLKLQMEAELIGKNKCWDAHLGLVGRGSGRGSCSAVLQPATGGRRRCLCVSFNQHFFPHVL